LENRGFTPLFPTSTPQKGIFLGVFSRGGL
jgi:hypothetical protein